MRRLESRKADRSKYQVFRPHDYLASKLIYNRIVMRTPSQYQQAIYDAVTSGIPHNIFVNAVAGSGKTTTLEGICELLTSEQRRKSVFCAFSKAIQLELERRLPSDMTVRTIHSLSFQTLRSCLQPKNPRAWVEDSKYRARARIILETQFGYRDEELKSYADSVIDATKFCQLTLTNPCDPTAFWAMCDHYDITGFEGLASIVDGLLKWGIEVAKDIISYTDMIWLPVALDMSLPKWDTILVDEAQDISVCMRELLRRMMHATTRLIAVGDPRQAIFGFAGAGTDSVDKIIEEFGCVSLPLSICYRCPSSHLDMARGIVSHIEARPEAPVGTINHVSPDHLTKHVNAMREDLVICRTNAPLVELAFRMLALGIPVTLKGRDLLSQLMTMARRTVKLKGFKWENVHTHLDEYVQNQVRVLKQRKGTDMRIQSIQDQSDALSIIISKAEEHYGRHIRDISELDRFMDRLYGEEKGRVVLSSVHKAKGLEADHIVIYGEENMPHCMAKTEWELVQEMNLRYVALTRAKDTLTFVPLPKKDR